MPRVSMVVVAAVVVAGCHAATRVIEEPRVDLDVSGGNRGYLVGTPPPAAESADTTRQMVETEVEVPSGYRPKKGQPVSLGEVAPPEMDFSDADNGGAALDLDIGPQLLFCLGPDPKRRRVRRKPA